MSAADQVAAVRQHWPAALGALKRIPAAVADKALPLEDLHCQALEAELDSRRVVRLTAGHASRVAGRPGYAPDARKVLVDEFKVGGLALVALLSFSEVDCSTPELRLTP